MMSGRESRRRARHARRARRLARARGAWARLRTPSAAVGGVVLLVFGGVCVWAGVRAAAAGPIILGAVMLLVGGASVFAITRAEVLRQLTAANELEESPAEALSVQAEEGDRE